MLVKTIIVGLFFLILLSLGTAFFSLFRKRAPEKDDTTAVKALTMRVGLSIFLLGTIAVLYAFGLIQPNG